MFIMENCMAVRFCSFGACCKNDNAEVISYRNSLCLLISFIEDNIENGIRLDDVVSFSGYSRRHVQSLFQKALSISVGTYIRNRKIIRAATMLRLTNESIIDIAFRLHYDSQQTFSREFKKITGNTPQRYRRNDIWNLSPYRINIPSNFSIENHPEMVILESDTIYGYQITYECPVPTKRFVIHAKWDNVKSFMQRTKDDVWLLTSISPGCRNLNNVQVCTVIGAREKNTSVINAGRFAYEAGLYAKFIFYDIKDNYNNYVSFLYYRVLPFLKLNRRNGVDIECIRYNDIDNGKISCDIYIPVAPAI